MSQKQFSIYTPRDIKEMPSSTSSENSRGYYVLLDNKNTGESYRFPIEEIPEGDEGWKPIRNGPPFPIPVNIRGVLGTVGKSPLKAGYAHLTKLMPMAGRPVPFYAIRGVDPFNTDLSVPDKYYAVPAYANDVSQTIVTNVNSMIEEVNIGVDEDKKTVTFRITYPSGKNSGPLVVLLSNVKAMIRYSQTATIPANNKAQKDMIDKASLFYEAVMQLVGRYPDRDRLLRKLFVESERLFVVKDPEEKRENVSQTLEPDALLDAAKGQTLFRPSSFDTGAIEGNVQKRADSMSTPLAFVNDPTQLNYQNA